MGAFGFGAVLTICWSECFGFRWLRSQSFDLRVLYLKSANGTLLRALDVRSSGLHSRGSISWTVSSKFFANLYFYTWLLRTFNLLLGKIVSLGCIGAVEMIKSFETIQVRNAFWVENVKFYILMKFNIVLYSSPCWLLIFGSAINYNIGFYLKKLRCFYKKLTKTTCGWFKFTKSKIVGISQNTTEHMLIAARASSFEYISNIVAGAGQTFQLSPLTARTRAILICNDRLLLLLQGALRVSCGDWLKCFWISLFQSVISLFSL